MKRTVAPVALAVAMLATACGGGGGATTVADPAAPSTTAPSAASPSTVAATGGSTTAPAGAPAASSAPATVRIRPMFYNGSTGKGGLADFSLGVQRSSTALRIDFSEDEVAGLGDQYRAAVWNAVTVATLLTGKPLTGTYRAEVKGYIDGPSAGALTTVGVLALLRGETLRAEVTMTGTINPDGTVGPVGGIAEKLIGAKELGIKTVLIPAGQRNTTSTSGESVDVVDLGRRNGVEVREVLDVYEAYEAFTGKPLPRLTSTSGGVRLDEKTYQRLKAKADEALANTRQSLTKLGAVDPALIELVESLVVEADRYAGQARTLQSQGLQAGAFSAAWQASAYAATALSTAENVQVLFTGGIGAYFQRVFASQAIADRTFALLDTLKTFTPRTLSDAAVLVTAYGSAIDAYAIGVFGENQLRSIEGSLANLSLDQVIGLVIVPSVYFELAGHVVDYSKAMFDVGRDLDGPPIKESVPLGTISDFFRKASDANFQAFRTTVVNSYAERAGINENGMLTRFANFDADVALAVTERNLIEKLKKYIGDGEPNAQYAQLGFAVTNFARNAGLVAKYYSNGQLDGNGMVVGVRSQVALTGSLDLGRNQLTASIGILRSKNASPALLVAAIESAGVLREGSTDDKFTALGTYWQALVTARVLAYLGGFESAGLQG